MSQHLSEVEALLAPRDETKAVEFDLVARSLQTLALHQVVYSDSFSKEVYDFLVRHIGFVRSYFAAQDYAVVYDPTAAMVAIKPGQVVHNLHAVRLGKEETEVGCALRLLYTREISAATENRRVETTTEELYDVMQQVSRAVEERRLREILLAFKRRGCVDVGAKDQDGLIPLTILPGIEVVIDNDFLEALRVLGGRDGPSELEEARRQQREAEQAEWDVHAPVDTGEAA